MYYSDKHSFIPSQCLRYTMETLSALSGASVAVNCTSKHFDAKGRGTKSNKIYVRHPYVHKLYTI